MKRRQFFLTTTLGTTGMICLPPGTTFAQEKNKYRYDHSHLPKFSTRKLTTGPEHHFFGYYGTSPWNLSETLMMGMESDFHDRLPEAGEKARIGLVDPLNGSFTAVTETLTWNLQQGAMLHWNPLDPDRQIIYNDRIDGRIGAYSLEVQSGKKSILPGPVSAVSKKGKSALSFSYGRLSRMRKVVGYAEASDPYAQEAHPEKDGIYLMDLKENNMRLILSIAEVFALAVEDYQELAKRLIWFNHTDINPSGTRFLFLARSRNKQNKLDSAMFTANMDGSGLRMVIPFGSSVSHFGWRNDNEIVATLIRPGETEYRHVLFTDGQKDFSVIGKDFIRDNGHCTFSPDGRWMATDRTHDDTRSTSLWLYDMQLDKGTMLCNLPVPEYKYLHTSTRCDFHPRWNPSGNKICFDAIDTATQSRQMHLVEFKMDES
jgi:hypothetical protein